MACVEALHVLKIAETAVPAGLLAGDEYSVTSSTNLCLTRVGVGGGLKQNWVFLAGLSDTMSEESCKYPRDHLDYLKTCHFPGKTRTLGCGEAGRAVGGKGIILLLHPVRWEWRCSRSFIMSSLIPFSSDFLHTSAMWVYFSECENGFVFAGNFGACGKLCNCGSVGPRLCVKGKKALSEIYFYQLISRSCLVITIPSSSLKWGHGWARNAAASKAAHPHGCRFNSFQTVPLNPRADSTGGGGI